MSSPVAENRDAHQGQPRAELSRVPAPFTIPHSLGPGRLRIWFSLRARDRLNEYTRVWFQALVHFLANKRAVAPAVVLAKSASAQDLALMLCSTEVKIWAGREAAGDAAMTSPRVVLVRHGGAYPHKAEGAGVVGA